MHASERRLVQSRAEEREVERHLDGRCPTARSQEMSLEHVEVELKEGGRRHGMH